MDTSQTCNTSLDMNTALDVNTSIENIAPFAINFSLNTDASPNIIVSQASNAGPLTAALATPPTSPSHKRKADKTDHNETKASAPKAKRPKKTVPQALTSAEIEHAKAKSALAVVLREATQPNPAPQATPVSTFEILCPVDWSLLALKGLEPEEIEAYRLRAPWNPKQPSWDQIKDTVRAQDPKAPSAAEAYRKRFWISNRAVFLATGKYYTNSLPGLGMQKLQWKHALVPGTVSEKKDTGNKDPKSRFAPVPQYEGPVQEWYSHTPDPTPAHHVEVIVRANKYKIQNYTRLRACEFRCLPRSFPGWNWHKLRSVVDYQIKVTEEVTLRRSRRKLKRTRYLRDLVPNYFPGGEDGQGRFPNHPGYRLGGDWEPEVVRSDEGKATGLRVDPFVDRVVSAGELEFKEFWRR